jgi:hypothetical protein
MGISPVHIIPRTHRFNGKVERSYRTDREELCALLRGVVINHAKHFNEKIRECGHFHNYDRPHGSQGGQTPYKRYKQKTTTGETGWRRSPSVAKPPSVGVLVGVANCAVSPTTHSGPTATKNRNFPGAD